ncbi:EAL and GGDEF domain-containing protein [Schinkia sp. CFF1]
MSLIYQQFAQNSNMEILQLLEQMKSYCIDSESTALVEQLNEIFLRDYAYIKYALDASTIVAVTDKAGIVLYVNDKFCEISKYSRDELIGRTHRIVNSGFHSKDFYKMMWNTILSGKNWSGEIRNMAKDGSLYWVHSSIIPIHNKSTNEIDGFISLRTDITKGKEAEEQLRKVIKNDFERTIKNLDNMVFKVKKDQFGDLFITLVEGMLSQQLDISEGRFDRKRMKNFYGDEIVDHVMELTHAVFCGERCSFTHHYNGMALYTMLSPIVENGNIIEIIGSTNDITVLEQAQKEIQHMAYHNDLTNLPNRRKLSEDVHEKLEKIQNQTFAVLFIDIDRFKQINDTLGFHRGDKLILEFSKRLAQFVTNRGNVYHMNGDEFVIILESYENNESLALKVEDILAAIEEPFIIDDHELIVSCSIGVTTFPSNEDDNTEKILNRIETALKHCKLNGKQGFIFYNSEMAKDAKGRLNLEINLRKAIKNRELTLHYQPKFVLDSERMDGMEALVRWNSPTLGFVSPNEFISLAEETGLIVQLGEWVLYEACRQNQEWIEKGYQPMRIAVNVSAIEFLRPNYVENVKKILTKTGLNPQYLELEITENSFMQNFEKGINILNELKSLGIYISIDDFGTGYSSLGYLKRFPVNILKIDKCFIQEIANSENDVGIVKAIIQLGHIFNMKVIAEGVETEEVADILYDLKCDIVQGYYYSKPLPSELFEKLL